MKNQNEIWDKLYKNNLRWNLQTKNLPKILKGKTILELGVGNGKTLKSILSQKPKEVIALDNSSEALKIINIEFPLVKTINSSVTSILVEDNYFDIVVCYFTLNNLLEKERKIAIKEIQRVLKKGGILLFEDFAQGDFRQKESKTKIEKNTIQNKNSIICHFFTEKEIKDLFKDFKSLKIKLSSTNPIKNKPNLQRKIISAEAVK